MFSLVAFVIMLLLISMFYCDGPQGYFAMCAYEKEIRDAR